MRMPRIIGPRSGSAVTSPRQVVNEPAPVAAESERGLGATRSGLHLTERGGEMAPRSETLSPVMGCVRAGGSDSVAGCRRPVGVYYTSAAILTIIDPTTGSGAWLPVVIANPPWVMS